MNIDFYFDFISPYCYLTATRIAAFEAKHRVKFKWIPVNLPKLINLSGNTPPATIRNKALYSMRDLKRWAKHLNVPFRLIIPGSFDSRPALYIATQLQGDEQVRFCRSVFEALWSGLVDPTRDNWLDEIARIKGFTYTFPNQGRENLENNTKAALKAGAFGVPTFFVYGKGRPEMFFGLDHMDLIFQFAKWKTEKPLRPEG